MISRSSSRALYALAKTFRISWRSSAECAAMDVLIDGGAADLDFALGLEPQSRTSALYKTGIPFGSSSPMGWRIGAMKRVESGL